MRLRLVTCAAAAHAHVQAVARCSAYEKHGIAFVQNFLPADAFAELCQDTRSLHGKLKAEKGSIAVGRLGRVLDSRSAAHRLLTSDATTERLNRVVGSPSRLLTPSEYPIELRVYRAGAGMEWHVDDALYDVPQCEMVLVLSNDSDAVTEFEDASGALHSEWTPPNSALLVRAGGARHRVSSLKRGERTILKMVWRQEGSARLEDAFYTHLDSMPGLRAKQRPKAAESGRRGRRL